MKWGSVIAVIAVLIILGIILISKPAKRLYDDLILDNRYHYLSCEELPSLSEIDLVVFRHFDVVEKIIKEVGKENQGKEISPVFNRRHIADGESFTVSFDWGEVEACPTEKGELPKGEIIIRYPSHKNRVQIEQIINSKTFFGIPYNLINV